jgi:hypothetical protein
MHETEKEQVSHRVVPVSNKRFPVPRVNGNILSQNSSTKVWNGPPTILEIAAGILSWTTWCLHTTIKGYEGKDNDSSHVWLLLRLMQCGSTRPARSVRS